MKKSTSINLDNTIAVCSERGPRAAELLCQNEW